MDSLLRSALERASTQVLNLLPQAVLTALVLLAGIVAASFVYFICMRIFAVFAVDKIAAKTPLHRLLQSIGIHKTISQIIALLFFWTTIFFTLVFAAELLDLPQVSHVLAIITRFIPQLIAALLLLVSGMILARFLQTLARQAIEHLEIGYARFVGQVVYIVILILAIIAASEQLGFDLSFLTSNVLLAIFAILLIVGIGFVIAARSILENIVACYELKSHIAIGDVIEINNLSGAVKSFTFTSVILEQHHKRTVLPAVFFFTHPYTIS
ncbi:mechanosensitive ion channel [Candidatus Peregrinibacteria bacterium]|nr:mechanosensitive ion channel [Candidatus Peregrinibacteria bacterium]